ncbi:MAG: hypothetical protein E6G94_00625 [Alphaproteobacteria bacterium]|nr:MAG: hypothetical protein E6G94_00625 [Alphaproteobacteria bacterium]
MSLYLFAALLLAQTGDAPADTPQQQAKPAQPGSGDEVICKKKIVRGEGLLTNVKTRKVCKTRDEWDEGKPRGG